CERARQAHDAPLRQPDPAQHACHRASDGKERCAAVDSRFCVRGRRFATRSAVVPSADVPPSPDRHLRRQEGRGGLPARYGARLDLRLSRPADQRPANRPLSRRGTSRSPRHPQDLARRCRRFHPERAACPCVRPQDRRRELLMFIGHFAVALAAKRAAPEVSLGTLFLAAQLADLVWPTLVLLGIESFAIRPGLTAVTPLDFTSYPYSHSLVALAGWGFALGVAYYALRRGLAGAAVLFGVVLTHWLLDVAT